MAIASPAFEPVPLPLALPVHVAVRMTTHTMSGPDGGRDAAASATILLAVLAGIGALWLAKEVFIPLAIALLFATVLRPLVRRLERWRLPASAAAALVVVVMVALLVGLGAALQSPVRDMAAGVPRSVSIARTKLESMTGRLRGLLGSTTGGGAQSQQAQPSQARPGPQQPAHFESQASSGPSGPPAALKSAFGMTASLLSEIVEELLLIFFLLAAGDAWMKKLARMAHSNERARLWPDIAGEMHDVVARYLVVTIVINACQSAVIGLALWAIGVPTPILWAALTFVAELVPYLGGIVMMALLLAAGFATNQGFGHALLAPGVYLLVTTLQNNLVSPIAYGRGLRLNPTMILLGVMFWWMVWGVAGAFLAVPILASLRVLGSRLPALQPLAVALEE